MTTVTSWKEHILDNIPVSDGDIGDVVTCILHSILFIRAPGPVRPSEATCHAFPTISYSLCAVGDVSRKVEQSVKSFEDLMTQQRGENTEGMYASHRVTSSNGKVTNGYIVIAFFERKVKKALFGFMTNEEKLYFEKWILPITSFPVYDPEINTEVALQNGLLYILSSVQSIDHIPNTMYDFEVGTNMPY